MNKQNNQTTSLPPPGYSQQQQYGYNTPMIPEEDNIDLKRYFSLFLSNWYWFAITLFIALSIAYGINRWSEKVYTVSGSLLIEDEEFSGGLTGAENFIPGGELFSSKQNLRNEIGILKSHKLNYKAIEQLPDFWVTITSVGKRGIAESRQYIDAPFSVVFDSLDTQAKGRRVDIIILDNVKYGLIIGDTIKKELRFGEIYTDHYNKFSLKKRNGYSFDDNASNKYYFWFNSIDGLANSYRGRLNVSPIDDEASLVTLSTSGFSAVQEADYINKLMEVYIDWGLDLKNATADSTIAFIENRLSYITNSLVEAESDLERFRLDNSLLDLSSEASLLQSKIQKYENEKHRIEFEKQYYTYLLKYLESKEESGEIASPSLVGISDPTLGGLIKRYSDLQQQKLKIKYSLNENQPAVILLESHLENTSLALIENVTNSLNSANQILLEIMGKISLVETKIEKLPETERQLINIQRKYDLNNTVYNYLMEKKAEAGIARASNVADNRIIDFAQIYNAIRIKPQDQRNYMIALILGLLLPILFIVIIDLLNNKIIDRRDIEKATDIPVIGYIGHNSYKSEIPVKNYPGSTLAESFRSIRTRLKFFPSENESQIISITSTVSGEGKTFTSANIATIYAMLGKKVLLIGLDLRKPKLHNILKVNNAIGLSSYLIGELNYKDAIITTEINNLLFTPSGPVPPNPSELIESKRMEDFFKMARADFDIIVVDTPPVAVVTDTLLLSSFIDINLFVVRQRYSSRNTVDLINELKQRNELKNLAILINDINLSGYYGYGLRYGNNFGGRGGYDYGYGLYGSYGYKRYGYKGNQYYTE